MAQCLGLCYFPQDISWITVLSLIGRLEFNDLKNMGSKNWYLISNKVWGVFYKCISMDKVLIYTYIQVENILKLPFWCTLLILNYQVYYCLFIKFTLSNVYLYEKYKEWYSYNISWNLERPCTTWHSPKISVLYK